MQSKYLISKALDTHILISTYSTFRQTLQQLIGNTSASLLEKHNETLLVHLNRCSVFVETLLPAKLLNLVVPGKCSNSFQHWNILQQSTSESSPKTSPNPFILPGPFPNQKALLTLRKTITVTQSFDLRESFFSINIGRRERFGGGDERRTQEKQQKKRLLMAPRRTPKKLGNKYLRVFLNVAALPSVENSFVSRSLACFTIF